MAGDLHILPAPTIDYASVNAADAIIEKALPQAAQVIVDLMMDEEAHQRLRLDAAKYLIDRKLGPPLKSSGDTTEDVARKMHELTQGVKLSGR